MSEVSPACYSDPGITNTNMQFAVLDVDADAPENQNVNPELEVGICCALSRMGVDLSIFECRSGGLILPLYRMGSSLMSSSCHMTDCMMPWW